MKMNIISPRAKVTTDTILVGKAGRISFGEDSQIMLSVQEGDYLLFANVGDTFFVAKKPQNFFGVKLTKSQSPKSRSLECTIKAVIKTGLIPGYYELSSQFTQKEEDTHGKEVDVTWFKMTKLDDK